MQIVDRLIKGYERYKVIASAVRAIADSAQPTSLQRSMTGIRNASLESRQNFGRTISMDKIERAIRTAQSGSMAALTDLSRETIDTDPHLSSVLFKRFGAVTTLPYEIHSAAGPGIDKERAKYFTSVVREHLLSIPNLRQRLLQMSWAVFDGRSAHEIIWKSVASVGTQFGRVSMVPARLDWIHPRRLNFGPRRELCVLDEGTNYSGSFQVSGISLEPDELDRLGMHGKFICWMPSLFGEYQEREGLAPKTMYWSFFKRYAQRERMILIELFGKPWRIIEVDEDSNASAEDLEAADTAADQLGGSSSARMPRGTKLNLVQLDADSGQNHRDVIDDCDRQLSKLVLGQTGTTDPMPSGGVGNTQADVMQDEQAIALIWDANALSEVISQQLCNRIIEVNFGEDQVVNAPKFVLRWDRPTDRRADIERLAKALNAGVEVALTEAYEATGFRQPDNDESIIRIDQPPQQPGSGNPPLPRAVVVYPKGLSPAAGEQLPPAAVASIDEGSRERAAGMISTADLAKVVTVNEARAAQNLPPLSFPGGGEDPDGDLTLIEFEAKKNSQIQVARTPVIEASREVSRIHLIEAQKPTIAYYDAVSAALGSEIADSIMAASQLSEFQLSHWFALANPKEDVSDHKQPATGNGNPEDIIGKGMRELTRTTDQWADQFATAVVGLGSAAAIYNTINKVGEDIDTQPYGRALERRMVHSAALGALDSNLVLDSQALEGFADLPFQRAMQIFREKDIITRPIWNTLEAEAKRKAFTVAGVESKAMLNTIHGELARQIGKGADLREFKQFMTDRLKSSGLIESGLPEKGIHSASHVETVFRTNVLNAYGAGRESHMSQPKVLQARPIWGISGINDNRQRPTHRQANGKFLYASDPFWQKAYPPFGFNCRCRVTSHRLSRELEVIPGSVLFFLPDEGFVSGIGNLLS